MRMNRFTILLALCFALMLPSCVDSDEVGENFYTFTDEMMGDYLETRPEYSEFSKLLDTTDVKSLLNTYGEYTCFAPTNEALFAFYQKKGRTSIKEFPYDTIVKIVYDHIIKDFVVPTSLFLNGRLAPLSMSERFITTNTIEYGGRRVYVVNSYSRIIDENIEVHNGVIHIIEKVLEPTEFNLVEAIRNNYKFKLFAETLVATGLNTLLGKIEDESYIPDPLFEPISGIGVMSAIPLSRKYGYTALVETDSTFAVNGINNMDDLAAYAKTVYDKVYPNDANITDIKNRRNSLNRFIAYHLINRQLGYTKFIYDLDNTGVAFPDKSHSIKTYDMFEYIEMMCPNTLLEVRTNRTSNEHTLFNMISTTGKAIRIVQTNKDNDAINGVYHEIDDILVYSTEFISELASKRLRMDAASFFPELINNNMRSSGVRQHWSIPRGYLENLTSSETTVFNYYNADDRFMDYQGDEIFMMNTLYDFSVITPPIPKGTYEIRFGYLSNGKRGVVQLYWDGKPCGIPLDLNIPSSNPQIGYKTPGSEPLDLEGYENDKMMRNRGYLKGPASFTSIDKIWRGEANARMTPYSLRRILGIYTFREDGTHILRAKASESSEFMFDFLEFVPLEVIEREGID